MGMGPCPLPLMLAPVSVCAVCVLQFFCFWGLPQSCCVFGFNTYGVLQYEYFVKICFKALGSPPESFKAMLRRGGSALHSGERVRIRWTESAAEWNYKLGSFVAVREIDGAFLVRMQAGSEPVAFPSQAVVRHFVAGDLVMIYAANDADEHREFHGQTGAYQKLVVSAADGEVMMRVNIDDRQLQTTFHDFWPCAVIPAAGPLLADLQKVGSPSSR